MTPRTFGITMIAVGISAVQPQAPAGFDPVGKWTVSTTTDQGQPATVSVEIAGKPGAYTGHAISPEKRVLPLRDLATTPSGMIALFDLPQGAIVVRLVRDASGSHVGAWGAVEQTYALTAVREK